jgi:hypothetical protein
MADLVIGTKLYNRATFLKNEYKITGVRKYEDSTLYEVIGLSCNHDEPCQVLLAYDKKNRNLRFVDDLNKEAENYRHYNDGVYYLSEREAEKAYLRKALNQAKEQVTKTENALKSAKEHFAKLEIAYNLTNPKE